MSPWRTYSLSLFLSVQVKVLITFNFFSQFIYLFNFLHQHISECHEMTECHRFELWKKNKKKNSSIPRRRDFVSSPAAFLSDVRATSFVLRFVLLDLFSYCFFNRICSALCRCRAECASLQKPADASLGKKKKKKGWQQCTEASFSALCKSGLEMREADNLIMWDDQRWIRLFYHFPLWKVHLISLCEAYEQMNLSRAAAVQVVFF